MMRLNILLAVGGQENDSTPVLANTEVSLLRQFDKVTLLPITSQIPSFPSFQTFCTSGVSMSAVVSASVLSASGGISSGPTAFPHFSSFMALRTSTFVGGFMFTCSSVAGLLVVFLDEVQVVVDSRAF
ncbi:unnamed protein product [Heterobilharzia americana]|nr:unnamed protein product [Heterobilharzia americana]